MPYVKTAKRDARKVTSKKRKSVTKKGSPANGSPAKGSKRRAAKKTFKTQTSSEFKPLWKGPYEHGVTQSLLSDFLVCRERFRLRVIEGLQEPEGYSKAISYGDMWHLCEEYHSSKKSWIKPLKEHVIQLQHQYPEDREEIVKWYRVCLTQFPIYQEHWRLHPDVVGRKPIYAEKTFDIPYNLPSGRIVLLRGKWDGVDHVGARSIYLQENKTKGDINEERMASELGSNLQTMFYLIALKEHLRQLKNPKMKASALAGVRYNVIRRPLSDWMGTYNIKQRKGRLVNKTKKVKTKTGKLTNKVVKGPDGKPVKIRVGEESLEKYYLRLGQLIQENTDHFFIRWKVTVTTQDLAKFKNECLNPILEQLCDWWDWISTPQGLKEPFANPVHFRLPFGIYNAIFLDRPTKYHQYVITGDKSNLVPADCMFKELE